MEQFVFFIIRIAFDYIPVSVNERRKISLSQEVGATGLLLYEAVSVITIC